MLALAVAGGVLAAVRFPRARIPLGAVAVAGPLLLAVVYPSGTSLTGNATSYWADVVMPTTVACLPLLLVATRAREARRAPRKGRPSGSSLVPILATRPAASRVLGSYTQYGSSAR